MCCLFLVCVAFQSVMLDHDLKCFRGMNLKTLIWSVQPFLNGDGSPFWPCPLRRAHTTCTLVVDLGSPSLFLVCVAFQSVKCFRWYEFKNSHLASAALFDRRSISVVPDHDICSFRWHEIIHNPHWQVRYAHPIEYPSLNTISIWSIQPFLLSKSRW